MVRVDSMRVVLTHRAVIGKAGPTPRRKKMASALAIGAIEGRSAALRPPPNGAAAGAGLSFPPVDAPLFGEIAEFAIGPGVVAQGAAAGPL